MTKARTKADKRRAKKAHGLPELAQTPTRKPRGRKRMAELDPARPALEARCRQSGKDITPDALRDAKSPWYGCEAGKAMASIVKDHAERLDLWDAIMHMRKVAHNRANAIGSPSRYPQCARLLQLHEALEADAETPPVDDRSEADKARAADAAWMKMHGWLGYVEGYAASIALRVVLDDQRCTDATAMVRALYCVLDGIRGRKIAYRGAFLPPEPH